MLMSKLAKHVEMKLLKVDAKLVRKLYSESSCCSLVLKKRFAKAEGIYSGPVIS